MKYLRLVKNKEDVTEKNNYKTIWYGNADNSVTYNDKYNSYIEATYNVTDAGETQLLSYISETNKFDISQLTEIWVDGIKQDTIDYYYTFDTTGEHKARFVFPSNEAPISLKKMFNNTQSYIPLISVDFSHFNEKYVTSINTIFQACTELTSIGDISNWDVSNITDMTGAFSKCVGLTYIGDLSNWDVSNVTNLQGIFMSCNKLTSIGDLSNWDVSNVTSIYRSFYFCYSLNSTGDLSNWNVSNVTNMSMTFTGCSNLTYIGDLSNWDVSNVTNMEATFYNCYNLTSIGDLSNWNVSNVTNMYYTFGTYDEFSKLTYIGDLSNWNVSNVTNISYIFHSCSNLTSIGDLSNWDVSNAIDIQSMFCNCFSLTSIGDLSNWDVSNATSIRAMFNWCINLDQVLDVSKWDISKCTTLEYAFNACNKLKLRGISNWNTTNITNMHGALRRCYSMEYDETDFSKWDTSKVTNMNQLFCNQEQGDDESYIGVKRTFAAIKHLPTMPSTTSTVSMFLYADELTTIGGANTISASISFSSSPLTRDSALVILNALDPDNPNTLTFSESTYALLSEDDKNIGINKGWTVTSGVD